jgi:hypothetical protein
MSKAPLCVAHRTAFSIGYPAFQKYPHLFDNRLPVHNSGTAGIGAQGNTDPYFTCRLNGSVFQAEPHLRLNRSTAAVNQPSRMNRHNFVAHLGHLNIEVLDSLIEKVTILYFSEIISLSLEIAKSEYKGWFSRYLVHPKPLLKALNLF